jgi:hypothetical protein
MKKTAFIVTCLYAVALSLAATAFVTKFSENLHCTQYTSFRIATFDMTAHEEEEIDGLPFVYRPPFAKPLRVYFAGSLLAFLYLPSLTAAAVAPGLLSRRGWLGVVGLVAALMIVDVVLPGVLIGERFRFLLLTGLVLFAFPTALLIPLVDWCASRPRQ